MPTATHPVTGVQLNRIEIERPALGFDDAVTAHLMRFAGEKVQLIAQFLGTNIARVYEVFNGEVHPGAYNRACELSRG